MTKTTDCGTNCEATTTFPAWQYRLKRKDLSAFGGGGTCNIKKERKPLYMELMTSGRLNTYLADINEKATEQMFLLVKQMAEREGVTEELKAQDQMLWVQRMNNIRDRATELVNHELIYV